MTAAESPQGPPEHRKCPHCSTDTRGVTRAVSGHLGANYLVLSPCRHVLPLVRGDRPRRLWA